MDSGRYLPTYLPTYPFFSLFRLIKLVWDYRDIGYLIEKVDVFIWSLFTIHYSLFMQ